jgi:hypothetical protein
MARRAFFSFHFERDSWRAGQVRNSNLTQPINGYIDKAKWEEVKMKGDQAIKNWIDEQLKGTSVTVVLIGKETADRKYVKYEIEKSIERGNGLLGIYINNVKNVLGETDEKGSNPLDNFTITVNGRIRVASNYFKTYTWSSVKGYNNLSTWIDESAELAGL